MTIENDKMIEDYYHKVKDQYPDLNFKQFAEICKSPFNYVKDSIRQGHFPRINIKYLGKFEPRVSKIKKHIIRVGIYYAKGYLTTEEYTRIVAAMEKTLADLLAEREEPDGIDEITIIDDTTTGDNADTDQEEAI